MKLLLPLLCFVFTPLSNAQSQDGSGLLALAAAKLPPCALQCTVVTISASTCELTDINCIKTNEKLLNALTVCVKSSCTVREALTAKKFLQDLLGAPIRDKRQLGTFTCLIVGGVAFLCYILRMIARLPTFGGQWGMDDWVMSAAMLIIIPLTVCAYLLNELGLGKDMWQVPFENITKILEIFYFTELLYLAAIALTKIAILLFYLRIFPQRALRRAIYVTIGLCILYMVSFITATALQCFPISLAWTRWDNEHEGKCFNLNVDAWMSAGVNIILDLIVISLPFNEIKNLVISRRRKFGVMFMFLGGGFVTIVSILRLKYLIQFSHTENVTWDYLPIGIWSAVESHVGVIVACLPAIRSLARHFRQRIFPKPPTTNSYYEDNSKDSSKKNSQKSHSRMWSSKIEGTRMGTLNRSKVHDKEDFVRLDEFELGLRPDLASSKAGAESRSPTETSLESTLTRCFKSDEDILPLTAAAAPIHQPLNGIKVQTEYSVDRASSHAGHIRRGPSEEELVEKR